jgi:modification methylase
MLEKKEPKRRGTKSSSFGVSKRESHDSSAFYARRLYSIPVIPRKVEYCENPLPPEVLDQVLCQDSRNMCRLPDCSVHLMVTSPPYNVGKDYDQDSSLDEYLELLRDVFSETYRVLVPGGGLASTLPILAGRHIYLFTVSLSQTCSRSVS